MGWAKNNLKKKWYYKSYGKISLDPWAYHSSCFHKSGYLDLCPYTCTLLVSLITSQQRSTPLLVVSWHEVLSRSAVRSKLRWNWELYTTTSMSSPGIAGVLLLLYPIRGNITCFTCFYGSFTPYVGISLASPLWSSDPVRCHRKQRYSLLIVFPHITSVCHF